MCDQELSIAFDGARVVVASNSPDVLSELSRTFQHFASRNLTGPVSILKVHRRGDLYRIESDAFNYENHLSEVLCCLDCEIVLCLLRYRKDLVWLHAGAAARGGSGILVSGPSGAGKSTLVTGLCQRGWSFLSDDVLPVDPSRDIALPFPVTATVRQHAGVALPKHRVAFLPKSEFSIGAEAICRAGTPITAIVLPRFQAGVSVSLDRCSPGSAALDLLNNCVQFTAQEGATFGYLCGLATRVPTFRISYGDPESAVRMLSAPPVWTAVGSV